MQFRRMALLILGFLIVISCLPQSAYAAQRQPTVQFELKKDGNGNFDLHINYCANINYVWIAYQELSPNTAHRELYINSGIYQCHTQIIYEVMVNDIIQIGVGGSSRPPSPNLDGTTYYRLERTTSGLTQEKTGQTPLLPRMITYVRFTWSTDLRGSIVTTYCINARYHGMRADEVSPSPKHLGFWEWGEINGCESRYVASEVLIGDVISIGLTASSDQDPESNDSEYLAFRVKRTKNGLECSVERPSPYNSGTEFIPISCRTFYPEL